MVTLPRNILPIHIRRCLIAYCILTIIGVIGLSYWVFRDPTPRAVETSHPVKRLDSTSKSGEQLSSVPPMIVSNLLEKRLRLIEMPKVEPETVDAFSKPATPSLPPPTFTSGKLIATFIEDTPEKSHAVFQMSNGPILIRVGQSLEQSGDVFTLQSVERRQVTLTIRGVQIVVSMPE